MDLSQGSLEPIFSALSRLGVKRAYVKRLAPNDNSKNQIYLGQDYTALNILPVGHIYTDKGRTGSKRDRFKAALSFSWMGNDGISYSAPDAQLILYPKYPEVRLSGFLRGCANSPKQLLAERGKGRVLILGATADNKIIGFAIAPNSPAAREVHNYANLPTAGIFSDATSILTGTSSPRRDLFYALRPIVEKGWIKAKRLRNGKAIFYNAPNAGGYTLEAELNINPNGISTPDYLGWEIKQYGVIELELPIAKSPITLMTPEPTAGEYVSAGVEAFVRKYGYRDQSGRPDRLNIGGIYRAGYPVDLTGLTLKLIGFDAIEGAIKDVDGGICLLNSKNIIAAKWSFADLMIHWNRKHNMVAYIPSIMREMPVREYRYGSIVDLGEGTEFTRFLTAIANGKIYYDPGIKLENCSTSHPKCKRRSQFRIKMPDMAALYYNFQPFDVLKMTT